MTLAMQMLLGGSAGEAIGGLLPPPEQDGLAGISVATSLSEVSVPRRIAIGAPGAGEDGSVFIYEFNGTNFSFLTTVLGPKIVGQDTEFGRAVALSDDGLKLIVGAPNQDATDTVDGGGRVHTYQWVTSQFIKDAAVLDSGDLTAGPNARFGETLVIDKAGTTLLIGAPGAVSGVGLAYTFIFSVTWSIVAGKLQGTLVGNARFGSSLDMGFGGLNAIVTQPVGAINAELHFFDRPNSTSQFILRQTTQIVDGANGAALDDAGQLAFVAGNKSGTLPVLESYGQIGNQTWTFRARLINVPVGIGSSYGLAVAASDDRIVVGAPDISAGGSVAIYSFQTNGNMAFLRTDVAPVPQNFARFGAALTVDTIPVYVAGEPERDRQSVSNAGNAYVLDPT